MTRLDRLKEKYASAILNTDREMPLSDEEWLIAWAEKAVPVVAWSKKKHAGWNHTELKCEHCEIGQLLRKLDEFEKENSL